MATSINVVLVVYIYQWNVNFGNAVTPTKPRPPTPLAMAVSYVEFDTYSFVLLGYFCLILVCIQCDYRE